MLSIAPENEFARSVLLGDWLGSADDPFDLTVGTVGSLTAYMAGFIPANQSPIALGGYRPWGLVR